MTPADVEDVCQRLVERWQADPTEWRPILEPLDYHLTVQVFAALRDTLRRRPTVAEFTAMYTESDPALRYRMSEDERLRGLAKVAELRSKLKSGAAVPLYEGPRREHCLQNSVDIVYGKAHDNHMTTTTRTIDSSSVAALMASKASDLDSHKRTLRNAIRGAARNGCTYWVGRTYTQSFISTDAPVDGMSPRGGIVDFECRADGTVLKFINA